MENRVDESANLSNLDSTKRLEYKRHFWQKLQEKDVASLWSLKNEINLTEIQVRVDPDSLATDTTGSLSGQVRKLMAEVQEMKKQKSSWYFGEVKQNRSILPAQKLRQTLQIL